MTNQSIFVLVPAYNPCRRLVSLIEALSQFNFRVLIVNDGSDQESLVHFAAAATAKNVEVIHHAVNLGKGAALKSGINHLLINYPEVQGVVTADADGQHLPDDIKKIAEALEGSSKLILGVRSFKGVVPLRSKIGNLLTKSLFNFFTRLGVEDTQTGLRGIPFIYMKYLLKLRSTGYEFELDMLLHTQRQNIQIAQIVIQTIYLNENAASHFNPIMDSLKIYFVLFRFVLSSFMTFFIDYITFSIAFYYTNHILMSQAIARIPAGAVNYQMNKSYVFHYGSNGKHLVLYYISLVAVLGLISHSLIIWLNQQLSVGVYWAKIIAELILFIISFSIQRDYIFKRKDS